MPTGSPYRHEGRDVWGTDAALALSIIMEDSYDYSHSGQRPSPLGNVSLILFARSWGRLDESEQNEMKTVRGVGIEYADNGYSRNGTRVVLRRSVDDPFNQSDVETVLAPLSKHVLDYYEIMSLPRPKIEPTGNFSNVDDTAVVASTTNVVRFDPLAITSD